MILVFKHTYIWIVIIARLEIHFFGGDGKEATPVPIPNTEVKPSKADDTAAVRQWESRTLPGYKKTRWSKDQRVFYCLNFDCMRIIRLVKM